MSRSKEVFQPPAELEDCLDLEVPEQAAVALSEKKLSFDDVVTGLSRWYLYTDAKLRGLEAELRPVIERMEGDLKELEDRKKYIKLTLQQILQPSKEANYVNAAVSLFYTETFATDIFDPGIIPFEYCKPPREPEPDTKRIKAALEAGEDVPGARLQQNLHIQIKEGGVRAEKNAKLRSKKRIDKIINEPREIEDEEGRDAV